MNKKFKFLFIDLSLNNLQIIESLTHHKSFTWNHKSAIFKSQLIYDSRTESLFKPDLTLNIYVNRIFLLMKLDLKLTQKTREAIGVILVNTNPGKYSLNLLFNPFLSPSEPIVEKGRIIDECLIQKKRLHLLVENQVL